MRWPIALAIIGIAAGIVSQTAPLYLPGTPRWVWGLIFWCGIVAILGAFVWGSVGLIRDKSGKPEHPRWFPRWRQQGSGWPPFYRLVPLNKAGELAYKRTYGSLLAAAAERPISSGEAPNPSGYLAGYIAKTKKTPLFGYNSVSGKLERISPGILDSCTLSEDATELHQFGKDAPIYEGLSIKRTDFKRVLLEMEAQWPAENT